MRKNKRIKDFDVSKIDNAIIELSNPEKLTDIVKSLVYCVIELREIVVEQSKEIDKLYSILNEHEQGLG